MKRRQINEFLDMVQDCQDRLPALAAELNADNYKVTWSIEDHGWGDGVEYTCIIGIQMPRNWMGSYVSADHPFEEAEKKIRATHAKWKAEEDARAAIREAEAIKQKLYDDYLDQLSNSQA